MNKEYYYIGTIIGPHALKGEVKIFSETDFKEERYQIGNTLYIEKNNQVIAVKVKSHREHKGNDLVSFEGYSSINDIEQFNKCKIYVHESQLQELDEDEFYYHQLIGSVVKTADRVLGKVKDIVNYGASDILIIEDDSKKEIMIPFIDEFIEEIDLEEQVIIIDPIEGLLGDE